MSVINKMLQDLDKRNGRPGGEAMAGDAIRSVKPTSRWHLGQNALLVIVGLVVALPAGGWWLQQRNSAVGSSRAIVAAPPVPVLANNPPPVAAQIPPAALVPAVAVADSTATVAEPAPIPAPQQVSGSASAASATARVATTPLKVDASAAPLPVTAANVPGTPDKVETPAPPPNAIAASPKAAGGKLYSAKQASANLLSEAVTLEQQGRQEEAKAPLQRLLAAHPLDVEARQMLVQLQLDTGQVEQARSLLAEGRRLLPAQSNFTLALARLAVDSGDVSGAIHLLEADRPSARDEPQYHAFLAALLLRVERYDEAIQHYLVALRSDPANGNWLLGVGVAFEGAGKRADAAEAYRRADGAPNLTPAMTSFLSERLARLGP
jgi:MSHA biogenesis protein MshN